jgi:hypothetical protein
MFSQCYKQIWGLYHLVMYWARSVLSTNLCQGPSTSCKVLMLSRLHDYLTEEIWRTRFTQGFQLGCYLMRHPAFTTSASVWSCWLLMDRAEVCAFFSYFLEYWLSQVPRFQYIYLQEAELIFMMFDENLGWRCHTKTCEHSHNKIGSDGNEPESSEATTVGAQSGDGNDSPQSRGGTTVSNEINSSPSQSRMAVHKHTSIDDVVCEVLFSHRCREYQIGLELDPMCEWHLEYYVCIWWMGAFSRSACI